MKIKEINQGNLPLLILIHGGNSTIDEWNEYVDFFKEKYTIYLVSISGHGEDFDSDYTSIHENATEINEYVKEKGFQSCYVYGRGLGAQIALSMIEQNPELITKVIFESVSCLNLGFYKYPMILGMNSSYKEDLDAIKEKKRLPKYKFKKMIKDNTSFVLDIRINNFKNKALIMYSKNDDKFFKKSAEYLHSYIEKSSILEFNYGHLFGLTHFYDIINHINEFFEN